MIKKSIQSLFVYLKRYHNKLPKDARIRTAVIGVLFGVVVAGIIFIIASASNQKDQKKVIYDNKKEQTQDLNEGLINIPKDAKSATCDYYTVDNIQNAINQKIATAKVSIPTTETDEGTVSACAYDVDDKSKSTISSIIITQRVFKKKDGANIAFNTLQRVRQKQDYQPINNNAFVDKQSKQLIILKNNKLTVIAITTKEGSLLKEQIYKNLVSL